MDGMWWSFLLAGVGIFGLFLAGKKRTAGWIVGLSAQILWIAYATATEQYGFYLSALGYGWVYGLNWYRWHKEASTKEEDMAGKYKKKSSPGLWHIRPQRWWYGWKTIKPWSFGTDELNRHTIVLGWTVTGRIVISYRQCPGQPKCDCPAVTYEEMEI